ncbi:conserved Plasmodium protein, unknown function [Plasmodium gallinaceum]|uniref:Growth arrest-specific protein 8 domain-containing protein n=1 Tax=Plasmodium gallinaceum TaxID=5849 RepID=A0A1J1GMZ2_PLAGA|nr:conserved Plasmodium protein, unknown function [Plasmodium gallinaceum]CRG93825.1 conserved Plasmodium protein, unknown function [Plasmodium gallinaceum]
MKNTKKLKSKKKTEKETLINELSSINKEIEDEKKNVEDINSKIKNIDDNIFLGYHDLKILKLELKNKEIELEENKAFKLLSSRKIENIINRYVLKCYETFLDNLTKNEIDIYEHSRTAEIEKKNQQSYKDYDKLINVTNIQHLNKLNSIILSQNELIDEINRRFTSNLKEMRKNYSKKINLERDKLDKKRQKTIFNLQKDKNENIKNILVEYNEKILNTQNYFKLILNDQLEMIQKLEDEKLNKKKNYFSKIKYLEEFKKNISIHKKKLENLDKDVKLLEKNINDYEMLKINLKKIKEKRKKQLKVLEELKLETDVKKMLLTRISKEYEELFNKNKMKLYSYLQKLLLENYFLETKMKLKNESLEINTIELKKWQESFDPKQNEILNKVLNDKFQNFENLKKGVENMIDLNEKNKESYESLMHLNYYSNDDLDVLKRENAP